MALPVVAVFNSSDDLVELLRIAIESAGLVVVTGHIADLRRGNIDLQAFVTQHKPTVVLYDLIPPYERQWHFLDHLRETSPLKGLPFVLTSTNARAARELAGRDDHVLEVLGRPFDLEEIVKVIRKTAGLDG